MGAASVETLAAKRLAEIGNKFLSAFDDASSEEKDPAVLRLAPSADDAVSSSDEASTGTEVDADDASSVSVSSSDDETGAGPQVFHFDSKAVRPQGRSSSSSQHHSDVGNQNGGGRPGSKRTAGTEAAAAADAAMLSTWTGSRSELLSLQRQVQTYGAAALDKKAKKQFDATQLAKLGARAEKAPRMPASVGKGLKRKHSVRAERAEEEAVEAGHISRRDITKLRRRQKAATSRKPDAGLTEHGGAFRGGVLRVSGPAGGKAQRKGKRQRGGK